MAKAIKWQIPFATNDPTNPTQYRIDIYAEGYTGQPIQLLGGPQPFVTEENKSEDFFTPVRSQTGNIQVCTKLPSGGTLDINDLLPANNIDHPVRLVSISGSTETIEWQGFMSCEAFSQSYTDIPEIFSFPVLSVLEAMDSVQVNTLRSTGIQTINKVLYNALHEIDIQSGMTNFVNIHYSYVGSDVFNKMLDQSNLYRIKECGGYGQVFTMLDGESCKKVVSTLCTFMGWVAREQGTDIYLQRIQDDDEMCRQALAAFNEGTDSYTGEQMVESPMDSVFADKWRGTGHRRNISQGAKSVNISSSLQSYLLDVKLPETPKQSLVANPSARWLKWGEYHANSIKDYYDYITFQSVRMNIYAGSNHNDAFEAGMTVQQLLQYTETMPWKNVQWYQDIEDLAKPTGTKSGTYTDYTTAFLNVSLGTESELKDGLMIIAEPYEFYYDRGTALARGMDLEDLTASHFLYRQRSVRYFYAKDGYIHVKVAKRGYLGMFSGYYTGGGVVSPSLTMAVKWGDKWAYVDRSGTVVRYLWDSVFHTFDMPLDGDAELVFPVQAANNGEVTVYIFPVIKGRIGGTISPSGDLVDDTISGVMLTGLDISYEAAESQLLSDDSTNNYFRLLKSNFREEIDIKSDIASNLNNNMSPSLLMDNETTPASTITVDDEEVKPEVDLLDRLAEYYGASRQTLELIVAHPTAAPLPLLRLNGISPDTRKYLPLAESRDWQEETCTLTCFETPN